MKKTNNYNLSLYEKTDKMSITAEENSLNHNMEIIDEVLKEHNVNYLLKNQGSENAGKILVVGEDGNLTLTDMPSGDGDVVGYVDANNTIILTGSLTAGTYTFKYEGTDGTVGDIGTFTIEGGEAYINLVPTSIDSSGAIFNTTGYKQNYRLSSSGGETALDGAITSGFIPFGTENDIVRITGLDVGAGISATGNNILFYDSSFAKIGYVNSTGGGQVGYTITTDEVTGTQMLTVDFSAISLVSGGTVSALKDTAYIRVSLNTCSDPSTFIVTMNEEIV